MEHINKGGGNMKTELDYNFITVEQCLNYLSENVSCECDADNKKVCLNK